MVRLEEKTDFVRVNGVFELSRFTPMNKIVFVFRSVSQRFSDHTSKSSMPCAFESHWKTDIHILWQVLSLTKPQADHTRFLSHEATRNMTTPVYSM